MILCLRCVAVSLSVLSPQAPSPSLVCEGAAALAPPRSRLQGLAAGSALLISPWRFTTGDGYQRMQPRVAGGEALYYALYRSSPDTWQRCVRVIERTSG